MFTDYRLELHQPAVFNNSLEPVDIKPCVLGDDWFLSALTTLVERPALIERLFLTIYVKELSRHAFLDLTGRLHIKAEKP